jgi:hypothetical protein
MLEYILIVGISYTTYAVILTPVFYFSIGLTVDQILAWLWQGFVIDLLVAYPAGKLIIWTRNKVSGILDG